MLKRILCEIQPQGLVTFQGGLKNNSLEKKMQMGKKLKRFQKYALERKMW